MVALGSTSFNYVYMLLGDGAGHFTVSKFIGDTATGNATIADVNSDGIPDILSAGGSVFIGKCDGTFSTNLQYHFASCIYADFEKTNKVSAACASGVNTLTFFHINPDGSFNLTNPLGSVSFAGSFQFTSVLQALDVNGDGILDLMLSSNDGLQVAIGKPGLTFSTPLPYAAGTTTATNYVTGVFSDLEMETAILTLCRQGRTVST